MTDKGKNRLDISIVILFFLILISFLLSDLSSWYNETFGVTFEAIMYTVRAPLKGADMSFFQPLIGRFIRSGLITVVIVLGVKIAIFVYDRLYNSKQQKKEIKKKILKIFQFCLYVVLALYCVKILYGLEVTLKIKEYIEARMNKTMFYEEYYVSPDSVSIESEKKKNIIYIYMESMETTYASEDVGGSQKNNNYIPNLTVLAREQISFSNSDKLGGFHRATGASWTAAALFSCESGIPFRFPVDGNYDFSDRVAFSPGTITLGDILEENGYYQEFLCGSDADFGGRRVFFEQHGSYEIYDLYTAINDGYINEDEQVWWGLEDHTLYEIAKDELTRIAETDQSFNLTMLTVDTHHVDGWVCEYCDNSHPEQLANVVECADRQIYEFVGWCSEQPWYDNTVIVIQGDHPRMDNSLIEGVDENERTIYNCFINTDFSRENVRCSERECNSYDMFPTVLTAMGYSIEGDRLGFGTNLFSDRETLCEELGYEYVNKELAKKSVFYEEHFY